MALTEITPSSFAGILLVCLGIYLAVSRAWVARSAADWDYQAFGLRLDDKWYETTFAVWAVGFIVIGLLAASGIIRLSPSF